MKKAFACMIFLCGFSAQVRAQESGILDTRPAWQRNTKPLNLFGMETYANTGNLIQTASTTRWKANSASWEAYYTASIPNYDWISIGAGMEIGGSIGYDNFGTVYSHTLKESYYFVFQTYLNVSPWFTLHFNSDGRAQFRLRYTADFVNPVQDNFTHFLLTEFRFGFFLAGNQINLTYGNIDKFWIDSPSLEFMYFIQFHKNVGFRWFSKFYVNNGLFYNTSGITSKESIPMEHYARLDFILGNGITIWTRVQWNIFNTDFNAWTLFPDKNPYDLQVRAGLILLVDFNQTTRARAEI